MSALNEDNGRKSSIRIALYWSLVFSGVVIQSVCFIMIMQTIKDNPIDYLGIAAVIAAMSSFVGVIIGAKAYQKGKETKTT